MTENQGISVDTTSVPPQRQGAIPEQPSTWPVVIAVIGLVFSTFGVLGGCITAASPWLADAMASFLPEDERAGFELVKQWQWWLVADALVWLLLSILMIFACAKLIKRRASSRNLIFMWALLKIGYAIGDSVLSYLMAASALAQDEDVSAGFLGIIGIGGAVLNFLFYAALPVFMLIWFSRSRIRDEMAGWDRKA